MKKAVLLIVIGVICIVISSLMLDKRVREAEAASIAERITLIEECEDGSRIYEVDGHKYKVTFGEGTWNTKN